MGNQLSRRGFRGVAGSFAGAAALSPFLAACGDGGTKATGASTEQGLKAALPAYVPNAHLQPDIPSVAGGPDVFTDPGLLTYPADRVATVSGVPGKGGSYSAVTPLWGTVPPAGNSFYEAMNKALGVSLTMKPADGNNYNTIVPTMTAAKRPSAAWRTGVWGDKLYGIPCGATGCATAGAIMYRRDVLGAKGITPDQVKKVAEVKDVIRSWRSSGGDNYVKWTDENVFQKYGSGQ